MKESDKEEDGNENVEFGSGSLAEALPTPKKRTRTKKGWFFF